MKNTLETRLGLFFALTLIAAFAIMEMVGGAAFWKSGVNVRAFFDNAHDLKVGDPVKMAGVPIGKVTRLHLTQNQVEVTMRLTEPGQVHTSSQARIKFSGLMGQNYVDINFGKTGSPAVSSDAVLETVAQPDLSTLMAKLNDVATGVEGLTKSFSGQNFSTLLGPFTDFLKQNNDKLSTILGNLQDISTQIAAGKGTVGRLIKEDTLYTAAYSAVTNLNHTAEGIQQTIDQARAVVSDVNAGKGTLGKLAKDEALYQETTTAMTNLKEILQKINRGQGSVGKLVNEETFYQNAKMTLQKVDKATEGLEDQGPLSVVGMAVGNLF